MRSILVGLLVFGALPIILMRPHVGALVWAWLGFMNPHRLAWGFAAEFPFAQVVAVTTFAGMLFTRRWRFPPITRDTLILAGLVLWMQVTTLLALNQTDAWDQNVKVLKIQLMILVTMMLIRTTGHLRELIWVVAASVGFYGVKGGLFTIVTGGEHRVWGPDDTFLGGNNEVGLALIMTIPLMRYLHLTASQRFVRYGLLGSMILCAVAILGTQSRGAILGVIAMLGFFLWKSKRRLGTALLILIAAPIALGVMPQQWFDRMDTIRDYQQDQSAMARLNSWGFALNVAMDRPAIGGGFEVFRPEYFAIYAPNPAVSFDAHSIYFEILGEHGFVGLWLFLCLAGSVWWSCSQVIRRAGTDPELVQLEHLARMIQVSLIGYAVGGAFLGLAYFDLYYTLVALAVLARSMVGEYSGEAADERPAAPGDLGRRPPVLRTPRVQRLS